MNMKFFVFAIALFVPLIAHAESLTPEQAAQIGACSGPLMTAYNAHTVSMAGYQYGLIECYKKAGAAYLIPSAWRTATSSDAVGELNARATAAVQALWNNDTLRINFPELQEQLQQVDISPEVAQTLSACIQNAVATGAADTLPRAQTQRDIAACFMGTPYEKFLSPVYTKIAAVIDCGTDKLGVERTSDVTRLIQSPTANEIEIIKQCYIERTAPVISSIALLNVVATNGVRDVALLIYMTATSIWLGLRGKKSQFGVIENTLTHLPVDLAIVRLQLADTKKIIRTAVSDARGRFYLFAPAGSYEVSATKPGFTFPSQFVHEQTAVTMQDTAPVLQETFFVDPMVQEPVVPHEQWRRIGRGASMVIAIGSPVAGIGSAIIVHKWWMIALALLNIGVYGAFRYFNMRLRPRAFGTVLTVDKKPAAGLPVRVFETKYNKLAATTRTDTHGRYGVLVGPGTYIVQIENTERTVSITEARGVIAESIILAPAAVPEK